MAGQIEKMKREKGMFERLVFQTKISVKYRLENFYIPNL
jgi:hypothetical protein